jgi:hypothetical protein
MLEAMLEGEAHSIGRKLVELAKSRREPRARGPVSTGSCRSAWTSRSTFRLSRSGPWLIGRRHRPPCCRRSGRAGSRPRKLAISRRSSACICGRSTRPTARGSPGSRRRGAPGSARCSDDAGRAAGARRRKSGLSASGKPPGEHFCTVCCKLAEIAANQRKRPPIREREGQIVAARELDGDCAGHVPASAARYISLNREQARLVRHAGLGLVERQGSRASSVLAA